MEPATKRRKPPTAQHDEDDEDDEDDELFLEPDELNRRRDPDFQLQQSRDLAARKLKSRFEDIFTKYGRDFEGIGDEVDIISGRLVVDNGHVQSLIPTEFGGGGVDGGDGDDDDDDDDKDDGKSTDEKDQAHVDSATMPNDPFQSSNQALSQMRPRMSSILGQQTSHLTPLSSFDSSTFQKSHLGLDPAWYTPELPSAFRQSLSIDPAWQAPDLPASAFLRDNNQQPPPKITRKGLHVSLGADADEEDNIFFDQRAFDAENQEGPTSPLIKKFPGLDSSPNDNNYNDLINQVMENLPSSPPEVRKMRTLKSLGKPTPLGLQSTKKNPAADGKKRSAQSSKHDMPLAVDGANLAPDMPDPDAQKTVHDLTEEALWEDADLDSFVDVTGVDLCTSSSPRLFVDIRFTTQQAGQNEAMDDIAAAETNRQRKTKRVDKVAKNAPRANLPVRHFQRNVVDPDFNFSDEDESTLLPKRKRLSNTGFTTPMGLSIELPTELSNKVLELPDETSQPLPLQEERPKPSTEESEALKPKRGRPRSRKQEPRSSRAVVQPLQGPQTSPSPMPPQSPLLSELFLQSDSNKAALQNEPAADTTTDVATSLPIPHTQQQSSPELGDSITVTADTTAESRAQLHSTFKATAKTKSQPKRIQKKSPASTDLKTPKVDNGISTAPATAASLISLFPDAEDDGEQDTENETSFSLSDFPPSGRRHHHQPLVHRPFHLPTATPRPSASSRNSNLTTTTHTITTTTRIPTDRKNRNPPKHHDDTSLPINDSRSAESRAFFATPSGKDTADLASARSATEEIGPSKIHRPKKRRQLAYSVVRVRKASDITTADSPGSSKDSSQRRQQRPAKRQRPTQDSSPTAAIVHTPGGSRRRCGDDGWQCERDFCFVCT
ncbi:hypothetical protein BD289DRAFT_485373 [Coniella lustricola]|uniref:Centromere protein Scm3-domain-containing protein n=1 Tax=Coniella lustricola TaxID=2025994 RepID=A0A2T2ZYW7_9PEZI|nr:hypothetical protein BD289DRAFT_485373 [Coniella lustricola]